MIPYLFTGLFVLVGAFALYTTMSKYLLIKNTAIQRVRSVSQGFAQLQGHAEPIKVVETPISKVPAVAFRVEIYQYVSSGSGKNRSRRKDTILDITHAPRFMLRDDTGRIMIDAPNERNLFNLLRPAHHREYTISRGGFFDAIRKSFAQSRGLFETRRLMFDYGRAYMAFLKSGDYAPVEEVIGKIVTDLQKNLESFEPAVERGRITWGNNKIYVTERAITPDEVVTVIGTVTSRDSAPIVTKGKEGAFLIGSGDEAQVLKSFRGPFIASAIFLLVSVLVLVILIMSGASA